MGQVVTYARLHIKRFLDFSNERFANKNDDQPQTAVFKEEFWLWNVMCWNEIVKKPSRNRLLRQDLTLRGTEAKNRLMRREFMSLGVVETNTILPPRWGSKLVIPSGIYMPGKGAVEVGAFSNNRNYPLVFKSQIYYSVVNN